MVLVFFDVGIADLGQQRFLVSEMVLGRFHKIGHETFAFIGLVIVDRRDDLVDDVGEALMLSIQGFVIQQE